MWGRRGLLLVLLLCGGCAASIPADVLRDAQFTVESLNSVYLLDGTGDQATPILERRRTRSGPAMHDNLYDDYIDPSLSPDRAHVACLRFRNNSEGGGNLDELMPFQSVEVLIVGIADRVERVVTSIPATSKGRVYRVLAPVWSRDGRRIFFVADRHVWSYALLEGRVEPVVELPGDFGGGFGAGRRYLRASPDGTRLFGLLGRSFGGDDVVVEIDIAGRRLTPLWSGRLSTGLASEVDRPLTAQVSDDVVQMVFGSRQRPVFAPRSSSDGRFYFFGRHEVGFLGRRWVAGYDRSTGTEFEVRTMWRTLFWK